MQYCPSCGKGIEDDIAFCPHCGSSLRAASQPAQGAPSAPTPPAAPLTPEQEKAGDSGLAASGLNFLFWGAGYFKLGIAKPFGRSWFVWPLFYVAYAFAAQVGLGLLHTRASSITITIPTGGSGTTPSITTGSGVSGLVYDGVALALVLVWIAIGLFLARDAYQRASSGDGLTPSWRAAAGNLYGRMTRPITPEGIVSHPAEAFSSIGGLLLGLGSLYQVLDQWLALGDLAAGEKDIEGLVLGLLVVYLAFNGDLWPGRRAPVGVVIIALALIAMTGATNYGYELGLGFALMGGALFMAKGTGQKT